MPPARMIDAHHHLWDLERVYYPWLTDEIEPNFLFGDYASIRKNYLPEDFRRDACGWNMRMSVHVEAERADGEQLKETAWLSEMHERHGLPNAIVGHAWLDDPALEQTLREHMKSPLFRGIRSKPKTAASPKDAPRQGPGTMGDPKWRAGLGVLESLGLVYDFRVPYYHLVEGAELARLFPRLQFVVNHAGLPRDRSPGGLAVWRAGMTALAALPNVAVKLSGLSLPGRPWSVDVQQGVITETIALFGVDRCMFGSNFPPDSCVTDYETMMRSFEAILCGLSADEQDRIYYRNAERYYRPIAGGN